MVIENMIPYTLHYNFTDDSKDSAEKQLVGVLQKGQSLDITTLDIENDLKFGIFIPDLELKSDKSISITKTTLSDAAKIIDLEDFHGGILSLNLDYTETEETPKLFTISCPHLILNRTDLVLRFGYKSSFQISEIAMGHPPDLDAEKAPPPTLFSFPQYKPIGSRAYIKILDCPWSEPVSFEAVNTSFVVTLPTNDQLSKHLAISIKPGAGKYALSNVVYIDPRFVIWNKTDVEVFLRQKSSTIQHTIKANERFNLAELRNGDAVFQLRMPDTEWSNEFTMDNIGIIHAKSDSNMGKRLIKLDIDVQGATMFVSMSHTPLWPFQFENNSGITVFYHQQGQDLNYKLEPKEKHSYSWDALANAEKLFVLIFNGREHVFDPKNIDDAQVIASDSDIPGGLQVTSVLEKEIINIKISTISKNSKHKASYDDGEPKILSSIKLRLQGIGLSCINSEGDEFIYTSAKILEFASQELQEETIYSASVKWFQVDNQSEVGISEVVIYPTLLSAKDALEEDKPVFFTSLIQSKTSTEQVQSFKLFTLLLQELSIDIDSEFLEMLIKFLTFPKNADPNVPEIDLFEESKLEFPTKSEQISKLYFESFLLQPAQFNISYSQLSSKEEDVEQRKSRNEVIGFAIDILTHTVGNIHDAQIKLQALSLSNPIFTTEKLMDSISKFYTKQIFGQFHHILGSADFLGNPAGLFNTVSSGVKNMFYDPLAGFEITKPGQFGLAVASGTGSLLKKTIFGVTDSVSKVTGSLAQGLSVLTLDTKYQRKRQNAKRNKPKHLGEGVTKGAKSLAQGISSGFTGLVTNPRDEVKKHGAVGAVSGIGKGLLGLVSKPVVAAVDFATDVTDGLKNTTNLGDQELGRERPPRYMGKNKILLVIDVLN